MGSQNVVISYKDHTSIREIVFAFTSSASGDASMSTKALDGELLNVISVPGSGASCPTNGFDLYLKDETYGVDHFLGFGANCSSTTTKVFSPCAHSGTYRTQAMVLSGKYNFIAKNAGALKTGVCIIHYR